MNRSPLKAAVLLLAFAWACQGLATAAPPRRGPRRPPETSSDAAFHPEAIAKLAVIVVSERRGAPGREVQTDQQRLVEDEFVQALLAKGYSVASRSDVEAIVKEQRFQRSGLTEGDAAAIGKMLNVPAVLVVRVTEASAQNVMAPKTRRYVTEVRATMGARLIGVESGSVWWIGKHGDVRLGASRGAVTDILADVADSLAAAFPGHKPEDKPADPKKK